MKKTFTYLALILLSFVFSCKSVQISELKPTSENEKLLPALKPKIDVNSFESAYSLGSSKSDGLGTAYTTGSGTGFISVGGMSSKSTFKKDKRVQESITLFEREVKNNITDPYGEQKGSIACRIDAAKTQATKRLLILPSAFTLFAINILGVPAWFYKTELELSVEIYNKQKELVGRYTAYGSHEVPVAMYYGYYAPWVKESGDEGGVRKTNIEAFKEAMNKIKTQIDNDYQRLNEKLKG